MSCSRRFGRCVVTHSRMRGRDERDRRGPGKVVVWELEAGSDRRRPAASSAGRCVAVLPVELPSGSTSTPTCRVGEDVHRCSLCWDFCPRAGPALRSAVATLDGDRDTESAAVAPLEVRSDSSDTYFRSPVGRRTRPGAVIEQFAVALGGPHEEAPDGGAVTRCCRAPVRPARSTARSCRYRVPTPMNRGRVWPRSPPPPPRWRRRRELLQPDHGPRRARSEVPTPCRPKPRIAVVGTPVRSRASRAMQAAGGRPVPTGVDAVVLTSPCCARRVSTTRR